MKRLAKFLIQYTWRPWVLRYLKKDRYYRFRGMKLLVKTGVFHPGFFFSTRFMINYLDQLELAQQSFLEVGSGSGMISLYAAQRGAMVTACDISTAAVENTRINADQHQLAISVLHSDLFDQLPAQSFDWIVINPPYYRGTAKDEAAQAWYAGPHLEYFKTLFDQAGAYMRTQSQLLMVLSDDCELDVIQQMAEEHHFNMVEVHARTIGWERNFIFKITKA